MSAARKVGSFGGGTAATPLVQDHAAPSFHRLLQGPHVVDTLDVDEVVLPLPTRQWGRHYHGELRRLALGGWYGLEQDVIVVTRETELGEDLPVTRLYHVNDPAVDRMLRILYDFWWDELTNTYRREGRLHQLLLTGSLLTFFNAVFVEEPAAGRTRVFYGTPLGRPVPDTQVAPEGGLDRLYRCGEFSLPRPRRRRRKPLSLTLPTGPQT